MELAFITVVPVRYNRYVVPAGELIAPIGERPDRIERLLAKGVVTAVPASAAEGMTVWEYVEPEPVEDEPEPEEAGDEEAGEEVEDYDFSQHNVAELKELAAEAGIEGAHGMKRDELIEALSY